MTPAEIKRARELCEAASPGPWTWYWFSGDHIRPIQNYSDFGKEFLVKDSDKYFIAAARELLPKCLNEIEKLRAVAEAAHNHADPISLVGCYEAMDALRKALKALEDGE